MSAVACTTPSSPCSSGTGMGFSLAALMDEVEALVRALLGAGAAARTRRAPQLPRGLPARARPGSLRGGGRGAARAPPPPRASAGSAATARDEYLELLMGSVIGPRSVAAPSPSSTATRPARRRWHGLTRRIRAPRSASSSTARGSSSPTASTNWRPPPSSARALSSDHAERRRRGLPVHPLDERLLAALAHGLPDCSGVALGFDRTLMLATGAAHIDEVLAFPTARA